MEEIKLEEEEKLQPPPPGWYRFKRLRLWHFPERRNNRFDMEIGAQVQDNPPVVHFVHRYSNLSRERAQFLYEVAESKSIKWIHVPSGTFYIESVAGEWE